MADAGLRSNGRWKRGSVDICGSANTGAVRTDMARSFRRAGMTAGLILDYLSDVVLSITTSRSRTETSYWIAIIQ